MPSKPVEDWRRKYIGYRYFSDFLGSDRDFFVLRRFDTLNARILLRLQHELSTLEEQLAKKDAELSSQTVSKNANNGSFSQDDPERRAILDIIQQKITEYNNFVVTYSNLKARPPVPETDIENTRRWITNNWNAIEESEVRWIQHKADLFSIAPIPKSPFRVFLEKSAWFRTSAISRVDDGWLQSPETEYEKYARQHITYADDEKIDRFADAVICFVGFAMLIAPLWILLHLDTRTKQLAIITAFIAVFLAMLQAVSVARPFETLAASAG